MPRCKILRDSEVEQLTSQCNRDCLKMVMNNSCCSCSHCNKDITSFVVVSSELVCRFHGFWSVGCLLRTRKTQLFINRVSSISSSPKPGLMHLGSTGSSALSIKQPSPLLSSSLSPSQSSSSYPWSCQLPMRSRPGPESSLSIFPSWRVQI